MHICHVNLAKGFSGGERQTLNLIRSLAEKKIQQTAVIRADSPLNQALAALPVTVRHVNHNLLGHLTTGRLQADLLHAHDGKAVYWCALQNIFRGSRYIITRRVDNPLKDKPLTRRAYKNAQAVVCLSHAIEAQVHQLTQGISTQRIPSSCSSFNADPERVQAIRSRYAGKFLIAQVGKLIRHKGFHVTIEAARQLQHSHPALHFLILGAGDQESALKDQAAELDNVSFLGHQADVGNYLAAIDLMVFPSLHEGLGSTILEAWQHGKPVIGSNAGGIPDMIEDHSNGLLVPPGDSEALAQALAKLYGDASLMQQFSKAATTSLQQFTPATVANRYLALYQQLVTKQ